MAVSQLNRWHSCMKMGRAFRACPLAISGIESSKRPLDDSEDDDETKRKQPRTQEAISQPGLDKALITLLDGFRSLEGAKISPDVPRPGGQKIRGLVPEGAMPLVEDLVKLIPDNLGTGPVPDLLNSNVVEVLWRSLFSESQGLMTANEGFSRESLSDTLSGSSLNEAWISALRIAESFLGKLLDVGFAPSTTTSLLSTSPTSTPQKGSGISAQTIGGLSAAGAAAIGAGILFKTRGSKGGGRGVSQPSPRGGGGKFFQAGVKSPVLLPR